MSDESLSKVLVLLQRPALALAEGWAFALEHLCGLCITLQLPVEPCTGYYGKLTAMRLGIGATMTYRQIGSIGRDMSDTAEIIHTVFVGDVRLATKDIYDRCMDLAKLIFRRHRHVGHGAACVLLIEQSAVTYHQSGDSGVGTVEECLQSSARHTSNTEILYIYLLIER